MPKRTSSKMRSSTRAAPRSLKRRRSTTLRRVTRRKRISDIHTFKGIVNAGYLFAIPSTSSTALGGQFIMQLSDLPILAQNGALSNSFDFVRFNKCKMEFLPKYNMSAGNLPLDAPTFLTGVDEIPLSSTSAALTQAPSWGTQNDEDSTVTEAKAYLARIITPDYIRGMPTGRETEIYKKHSVWFTPTFYNFLVNNVTGTVGGNTTGVYQQNKRKWVNLNYWNQPTNAEVQSKGPDFYGPMYCFGTNTTLITQYYDVKIHYSVSFRRLRGV